MSICKDNGTQSCKHLTPNGLNERHGGAHVPRCAHRRVPHFNHSGMWRLCFRRCICAEQALSCRSVTSFLKETRHSGVQNGNFIWPAGARHTGPAWQARSPPCDVQQLANFHGNVRKRKIADAAYPNAQCRFRKWLLPRGGAAGSASPQAPLASGKLSPTDAASPP